MQKKEEGRAENSPSMPCSSHAFCRADGAPALESWIPSYSLQPCAQPCAAFGVSLDQLGALAWSQYLERVLFLRSHYLHYTRWTPNSFGAHAQHWSDGIMEEKKTNTAEAFEA